nr:PREDICTED: heparan-sulfate 6-O-sulfotransferase 1-B [Bemisia tabaci]
MAKKNAGVQVDSDSAYLFSDSGSCDFKMEYKFRLNKLVFICALFVVISMVYFGFFFSDKVCALSNFKSPSCSEVSLRTPTPEHVVKLLSLLSDPFNSKLPNPGLSYDEIIHENFQFDMNAHDVMVFLHIQKTGGTSFGRHLVQDLDLQRPCTCQKKRKRCYCFRPNRNENWLFSRYSIGWKCGLHADWTELSSCVDAELIKNEGDSVKRRYFYISLLREPISRYLSEFRHVQRGATWKNSRHWCGGRVATEQELPKCYPGVVWSDVTFDSFTSCPYNLANNRQTRMMADLALVGCYNTSSYSKEDRDQILLASAKKNLANMAFFALTEYQKIGQYVFEETFNLRFAVTFSQHNSTLSNAVLATLTKDQIEKIRRLNSLDIELYEFAKSLMFSRFNKLQMRDPQFEERWNHLGELPNKTEFNWDDAIDDETTKTTTDT